MNSNPVTPAVGRILVWDWPVRVFHWLLVLSFAGAYLTSEGESWRYVHVTLGYTVAGLIAFRVLWGLIGSRHARFSAFVRGPKAALAYVKSLPSGEPVHTVGHNPAGALAIVGLLGLAALTTAFGWATYEEIGVAQFGESVTDWLGQIHAFFGNTMLALVGVHVLGVVVGSWVHRENLVRSMLSGFKRGPLTEAITRSWAVIGALLLAAVLGFWFLQWRDAPKPAVEAAAPMPSIPPATRLAASRTLTPEGPHAHPAG
ncbi:MAG: cytochrome b/b6 domain-containing protein [Leptothrix sp. (in: b-proteobacteria)]